MNVISNEGVCDKNISSCCGPENADSFKDQQYRFGSTHIHARTECHRVFLNGTLHFLRAVTSLKFDSVLRASAIDSGHSIIDSRDDGVNECVHTEKGSISTKLPN